MSGGIITKFEDHHQPGLGRVHDGGPPWNDGSEAAAILAIWWHLEPMVSNGGWPSVYYNNIGWAVPLAARGYRLLSMPKCAERCDLALRLVAAAQAQHPGADYSSETWLATTLMKAIDTNDWDRLDAGWADLTRGTEAALAAYVLAHSTRLMP